MGYRARGVGIGSSSRLATVRVGDTCKTVDVATAPATVAAEETSEVVSAFSFALPPIAVGALWEVLLCETYQPSPMAPAIICANRLETVYWLITGILTISRVIPTIQTQRDIRVVPL